MFRSTCKDSMYLKCYIQFVDKIFNLFVRKLSEIIKSPDSLLLILIQLMYTDHLRLIIDYIYTDNISVGENATQNVTDICTPRSACAANNAVDRNISTCTKTMAIGSTSQFKFTWWYIDLGEILSVYDIRIQFKDYGPDFGK